jgi:hypothetical protein
VCAFGAVEEHQVQLQEVPALSEHIVLLLAEVEEYTILPIMLVLVAEPEELDQVEI